MRARIFALTAAVAALAASPAFAQLEEIVVTAQKREQGANDVGITINAFTGEYLKDAGFSTAEDMALLTPGLTVNETAATGVPLYTIRGVGYQDPYANSSSTVGLYFDQVSLPFSVMTRGLMFDVARVEVLKGPQGDLYGRNTTAGQINFVSNKPTEEFEAGVTAGIGSYQTFDLEGFVSGAIGDNVRGRIAARSTQRNEGWQESLTRDDELGEIDTMAVRAMLDIDVGDNGSLLLAAHYVDDQSDNRANTAYNGELAGQTEFNNPYGALADYIVAGRPNFGETPPWYSTGDNEAADWTNSYTSPLDGRTWDIRPKRDNQLAGVSATFDWDFGDVSLTSITAFNQFDRIEANDWDGCFCNDSSNINTTDLSVFNQELRLSGGTDTFDWLAGLHYATDEMDEFYHYFMSDSVFGLGSLEYVGTPLEGAAAPFFLSPILELDTRYQQETDSIAVFGHVEWSFSENWRLTLGARYTSEERDWSGCTFSSSDGSLAAFLNTLFGTTLGPGDCGTIDDDPNSPTFVFGLLGTPNANDAFHVFTDTLKTDRWMGKVALDYAVSDDVLVYGSISNGFKSGNFNGANSNTTLQLQPIREEVLTAYEVGLKSTLADGRAQLNAAAFLYDYEDKQEQDGAVTFVGIISGTTNVPQSEVRGAEVELDWAPVDALRLKLGLAWLDTEVEEWLVTDRSQGNTWPVRNTVSAAGIELAQSPALTANALVSYQWPVANNRYVELAADASYQDETSGGAQPGEATPSFTVVGARVALGAETGKWRVLLWGRNITDEYYYPSAYIGGNGPFIRSAGMPRTWGISLDWRFGGY